ncbi:hypothetical protein EST38_g5427 [Candolleomyces aberdarensis]|uniref:F-box domain-containing protein n=1 Tax=Candolleomyces aberdarensis TaxID=2316362 RepID=A0A4V1Q408_9AGAR|nr:hypothetical protein EST38_g5427 [Candolleomyces aberdarensis]
MHPDIVGYNSTRWQRLRARITMFLVAFSAPEIPLLAALREWMLANYIADKIGKREGVLPRIAQRMRNLVAAILRERLARKVGLERTVEQDDGGQSWETVHGHFLLMGGVIFSVDGQLQYLEIEGLLDEGDDREPYVAARAALQSLPDRDMEISDRSKGDVVTKGLTLLQTTWFIVQLGVRKMQNINVTLLEILTLAYAIMNLFVYIFWWDKPLNVQSPIVINLTLVESKAVDPLGSPPDELENQPVLPASPPQTSIEGSDPPSQTGLEAKPGKAGNIFIRYRHDLEPTPRMNVIAFIVLLALLGISGGIYYIAWEFTFPLPVGRTLWRVFCSLITLAPFATPVAGFILTLIAGLLLLVISCICCSSKLFKRVLENKAFQKAIAIIVFIVFYTALPLDQSPLQSMSALFCPSCKFELIGSGSEDRVPPTPQLLGTNEVPSSTEARTISQCLSDVEEEIQQLESQIFQVRAILNRLESKRKKFKSFAHEHRGLLSPLRRIFPELLSEIFSWCPKGAPTHHTNFKIPDSFDPLHGPLLLSQICRSWRSAAITTPKLWTTIRLVVQPRFKLRVEILDLFLSRSGDCDLTIGVMNDLNASDVATGLVAQSSLHMPELRLLAREAHRWKSAIFYLPPYRIYWDALSEAKGKTSRLHHLGVYHSHGRLEEVVVDIFANSPQLASLSFNSHVSMGDLLIHKSTITHFRYEKVTRLMPFTPLELCVEVLQNLPNLEHCVLDCIVRPSTSWSIADITMEHLKHLDIKIEFETGANQDQASAFWKALQLPNLSFLQVESNSPASFFGHISFAHFVGRCRKLTELGIVLQSAQGEQLLAIIQYAATVTSLSLGLGRESFPQVLSSLMRPKSPSQRLLPGLRVLRVYPIPLRTEHVPSDKFLAAFMQMAQRRMTKASSITKGSKNALLDTALLYYPLDVEVAAEAVKACLHTMGLKNPGVLTFPAQLYCLRGSPNGSVIKIQRS